MSAREFWRRIAIWAWVAIWFAATIAVGIGGDWSALLSFSGLTLVGAYLLTVRPGHGLGRYLLVISLLTPQFYLASNVAIMSAVPVWVEMLIATLTWPFWMLIWGIVLFFPNGRLETRFDRVAASVVGGLVALEIVISIFDPEMLSVEGLHTGRANPIGIEALSPFFEVWNLVVPFLVVGEILLMLAALIVRWVRSGGVERLQFRWLVYGTASALLVLLVFVALPGWFGGAQTPLWVSVISSLALNFPAVAIGIAVTRHGLYDIGRVMSRTVTYAIAIVLAVGVYAGLVIGLTALIPGLPSVGVALATLAAAAVFLPVLRWVQRRLDRAFDRERYNAERVVEGFGERLRVEPDPSQASAELIAAVEQTLQPSAIGLWTSERAR